MATIKPALVQKKSQTLDQELAELCKMMNLMSERDVDATLAQVLKAMLEHSRQGPVGGSELSKLSGLNRITVIHHLKRLERGGIVKKEERRYILRFRSAEQMLMEFRKEMENDFEQMDELAREIDSHFEQMEQEFSLLRKKRRK